MPSSHEILVRPIITEKNTMLGEQDKYTFEVLEATNKIEIKRGSGRGLQGEGHHQHDHGARKLRRFGPPIWHDAVLEEGRRHARGGAAD